jgi:hypothetical protein
VGNGHIRAQVVALKQGCAVTLHAEGANQHRMSFANTFSNTLS